MTESEREDRVNKFMREVAPEIITHLLFYLDELAELKAVLDDYRKEK